MGINRVY